jgi:hypothetical protein
MARNGKDAWTEEHLTLLRREWRAGTSARDIATTLGRTEVSIRRAADRLGLKRQSQSTASRQVADETPEILEAWKAGLSVRAIAEAHSKSEHAVVLLASYHRARRPAGHQRRTAQPSG